MPGDPPRANAPATVCYFVESQVVGGTELALASYFRSIDTARWRPVLLHHGAPDLQPLVADLAAAGIRDVVVEPLPDGPRGAAAMPALIRILNQVRPQVFHARLTSPEGCKFALAAALAARVPAVVASVHAFPPMEMSRSAVWQRRLLGRGLKRYVVASSHAAGQLNALIPTSRGRTAVIPNGVELERYGSAADPALRRRLTADGRRSAVLVPARLDDRKGHRFLFEAVRDMPGMQVVLAGSGPHRGELERLADALGIAERVTFLGFRDDMPKLYAASDVVVLPTLNEAFGNVLLEGMAAGRPVISSRVGGPQEIIVDHVSGLLVRPADPPALRSALRSLADDPELAHKLAAGGRRRAEQCFSMEQVSARWSRLYAEVLDAPGVISRRGPTTTPIASHASPRA